MTTPSPIDSNRMARLRLAACSVLVATVAACGGGGGGSDGNPPPPPSGARCTDPTPSATSSVKFATPVAAAASSVELSANGLSACFLGTAAAGVKADVAVSPGADNFYYFEARRSQAAGVSFGVSVAAQTEAPAGGFAPRTDTLLITGEEASSVDGTAQLRSAGVGAGNVFGFAVDMRSTYPVINVIAPASVNPGACAGLAAATPCVVWRWQLAAPASSLSIYARGNGDGTAGPRLSINTGGDLTANPYAYSTPAVLAALRASRAEGDRGFNAQWPAAGGPASLPSLARSGFDRAVIRKGDASPYRSSFEVTPSNAAGGIVNWKDEAGTARGTGNALSLAAVVQALAVGEHVLTASVVNPQNGRYGETSFRLKVLATTDDTDDDGDGLAYSVERLKGLDPGNEDTDGDGLSDGAEEGLGKDPLQADNTEASAALPRRSSLAYETGTNRGLLVVDGLSVIFTNELNPACEQHVGTFADPIYVSAAYGPLERCRKRAIRANIGIEKGEFRYFETRRFSNLAEPENIGQGIITPSAQIDPYCCYVDPVDEAAIFPYTGTPPSMTVNSVGGLFVKLILFDSPGFSPGSGPNALSLTQTEHYGFAVDYRGTDPKVYVVGRDSAGDMIVSGPIEVTGFNNEKAMPMLHGHPTAAASPSAAMNLGLKRFHYDVAEVESALQARGANPSTDFKAGVGAHRW